MIKTILIITGIVLLILATLMIWTKYRANKKKKEPEWLIEPEPQINWTPINGSGRIIQDDTVTNIPVTHNVSVSSHKEPSQSRTQGTGYRVKKLY